MLFFQKGVSVRGISLSLFMISSARTLMPIVSLAHGISLMKYDALEHTGTITSTDFTAHVGSPMYRIDYVYSRGLMVQHSVVNQNIKVSDHYPVVVDFLLNGGSSL